MTGISINGNTALYGVIGNPVKHSFSPRMHTLAFQELEINAVYMPFLIEEQHLPQLLNAFEITGVQGFNITLPFKQKIIPYLDALSEEAELLQSVNTVARIENGWKGYSTDGSGFIRSLSASDMDLSGRSIAILGAGGAARAIAISLVMVGISNITLLNRTRSKAEQLAGLLYQIAPDANIKTSVSPGNPIEIIINATSVGMDGKSCPVADDLISKSHLVVDIIYNPPKTPLLQKAASFGISCVNGIDMLLYQGIEAFEIWTGQSAPVNIMRQSLKESLYSHSVPV